MTPFARQLLRKMLINDEQYKQYPYHDSTDHLTVGIGRNLTDRGISLEEALAMLDNDISFFATRLSSSLNWWSGVDDIRQVVLVNMCFNLGLNKFLEFNKMLQAIERRDYDLAAKEMLNSVWAEQVGERAIRLANIMRDGEISIT
jgi:lysozyme